MGDRDANKAELKAAIASEIRMKFGVITWLIWAWRIYSWVSVIWDAWNKEQE
jgi:biopolymer transport protein ExbB/TolQ